MYIFSGCHADSPRAIVPLLRFFNPVVEALCYFIKSYENWQLTLRFLHNVYL
jgi:hypothetical protein